MTKQKREELALLGTDWSSLPLATINRLSAATINRLSADTGTGFSKSLAPFTGNFIARSSAEPSDEARARRLGIKRGEPSFMRFRINLAARRAIRSTE